MQNERRLQERFFLNLKARISYSFINEASDQAVEAVAANISSGGAFLKTAQPLPPSSKVQVEFLISFDELKKLKFILPVETLKSLKEDQVWVKTTGIVIRSDERGVAIIFDQNYQISPLQPAGDINLEHSSF
ncbi:PilZ domain-containing protein [Desulfopila sp. IMCC35008]|uniref:PilZ domain-containing protein n=1 Tax=Desulfopila sp. IMCC35008 TaxID=2653858 RepID=UPI0013D84F6B|nr:PilZ domain-containing protein [Desulfopila sp. IMCC35008]